MSLVKKFATVASGTLMSRALGFGREMLMAAALGTGPIADAFNAAFQFPNTFRRLFAEGAFNAAFVPLFAKEIEANGPDGAKRFSEEVFGVLFTTLLAITIVMELAMPLIVRYVVAPGFADVPGKFETTVALATVMFPYLICMSLGAMMAGMLPTAIGRGEGSEFRAPMAIAVIGGVISSTLLSLLVVPAFYVAIEGIKGWIRKLRGKEPVSRRNVTLAEEPAE